MKLTFFAFAFCMCGLSVLAQDKKQVLKVDETKPVQLVEAACGQCQFKLPGKSCDLAVRINKQAYFVNGTSIDEHGDAHADDGFCNKIRKANVQGEVKNDRFLVTYFKLVLDSTKH